MRRPAGAIPESIKVTVGAVYGSADAASYAGMFIPLLSGKLADSQNIPSIKVGIPTSFTGVFVLSSTETDTTVTSRNAFVDVMTSLGILAHTGNVDGVSPGRLELLVSFRPEEVTPQ